MPKPGFIPQNLRPWIEARKRFRLSHAQVQMARELGMNPRKLGQLANSDQEPWKLLLSQFIESRYVRQFGRSTPADTRSIEKKVAAKRAKTETQKKANADGIGGG